MRHRSVMWLKILQTGTCPCKGKVPSRHTDVVSTLKQRRLSTLKQCWKMFDFVIELTSDFNVESTSSFNVETTSYLNVETTSYLNVETMSGFKKILKYILNVPQHLTRTLVDLMRTCITKQDDRKFRSSITFYSHWI